MDDFGVETQMRRHAACDIPVNSRRLPKPCGLTGTKVDEVVRSLSGLPATLLRARTIMTIDAAIYLTGRWARAEPWGAAGGGSLSLSLTSVQHAFGLMATPAMAPLSFQVGSSALTRR